MYHDFGRGKHLKSKAALASWRLQVAQAKILVVGAGGIGCELLKSLVLNGLRDITVVGGMGLVGTASIHGFRAGFYIPEFLTIRGTVLD